ncbi:histidine phosphatase family protein [Lysinibacillus agricola]|uniref:Histidine phosphatase family protein n=1 Tax=Lysinibacillus agricola TaxID=2590012 RepID=A0ABX7AXX3_9BACI|nr:MULTISPECIES: histidine phosphatase family protein [Lysinibacillus]KOS60282.1 phosphoglycerate mutase [Lysinibacillus sp. FJAT-14222]QQP14575.1 histidine phosphatase family protein [Lysinibacillus agricola]
MTTFYLVRHGETVWNKEHRLQGWLDSRLSEKGILHAEKLRDHLKNFSFTAAFSSSSGRAKETMHILVGDRQLPIYYEDNFREIFLGNWQGKTVGDIMTTHRLDYELYTDYPAQFVATHTESFGAVTERAMFTLKKIAEKYPEDNIIIVSHAVTIKCIINAILGRSIDQLWAAPFINGTSVTIIEQFQQQWVVKDIGNIQHLQ